MDTFGVYGHDVKGYKEDTAARLQDIFNALLLQGHEGEKKQNKKWVIKWVTDKEKPHQTANKWRSDAVPFWLPLLGSNQRPCG